MRSIGDAAPYIVIARRAKPDAAIRFTASLCEGGVMTAGHDGGREFKSFILSPSLAPLDSPLSEGAKVRIPTPVTSVTGSE